MDAKVAEQQETGLKAQVQRHPITVFLVLALGSVYVLSVIPILMQYDVIPGKNFPARLGLDMERFSSAVLTVLLFGSALLVTYLCGGRRDVRQFFRRILRWKVSIGWWLTAFLALPLLTVVIAVLLGDSAVLPSGNVLWREILGIAIAFLLINLWEEAAWAGFLQTRLERRHNFFLAALLTGIPFAAIHMPLQVITGQVRSAVDFAVGFALLMVLVLIVRSFYGMVLRGAANSLLLVGLSHTMFNRSNNTDGIAADILRGGDSRQVAALLATVVLVVVLGLVLRSKLSQSYRRELDAAEERTA
ncbi:MAG TPA: type II CAAX endopeptidase family protein [Propionibacteriaceae bacterium]|nr:type II CAAX endopeptidase family protein [Propionibacteriaceae bacterium]